jgi:hypothetical protein
MLRPLTLAVAAGTALSALAVVVPVTTHAAGTTGPCSFTSPNHPLQHTGNGHHSFTDSHDNCVQFGTTTGNTAFLDDSNFNSVIFTGNNNTLHDFENSSFNSISFGGSFDTLRGENANGNTFTYSSTAVNDVATLLGTHDTSGTITVSGSNDFLVFDASCTGNVSVSSSGLGTSNAPITIC